MYLIINPYPTKYLKRLWIKVPSEYLKGLWTFVFVGEKGAKHFFEVKLYFFSVNECRKASKYLFLRMKIQLEYMQVQGEHCVCSVSEGTWYRWKEVNQTNKTGRLLFNKKMPRELNNTDIYRLIALLWLFWLLTWRKEHYKR